MREVHDRRQWFLDAAYLEPVVTAGKYWVGGAGSWLLGDLSVSSLLSWPLGTACLIGGICGNHDTGLYSRGCLKGGSQTDKLRVCLS